MLDIHNEAEQVSFLIGGEHEKAESAAIDKAAGGIPLFPTSESQTIFLRVEFDIFKTKRFKDLDDFIWLIFEFCL